MGVGAELSPRVALRTVAEVGCSGGGLVITGVGPPPWHSDTAAATPGSSELHAVEQDAGLSAGVEQKLRALPLLKHHLTLALHSCTVTLEP